MFVAIKCCHTKFFACFGLSFFFFLIFGVKKVRNDVQLLSCLRQLGDAEGNAAALVKKI